MASAARCHRLALRLTFQLLWLLTTRRQRKKRSRCRKGRPWVRKHLLARDEHGACATSVMTMRLHDPDRFTTFARMPIALFDWLLKLVTPLIQRMDTNFRLAITAHDQLFITLHFLAFGDSYRSMELKFLVGESTMGQFIPIVCTAIYLVLRDKYLKSPSADPYSMSNHGSCDQLLPLLILSPLKVVTTPTAPTKHSVNCTPVKTPQRPIPASANPYSTPKHESPGQLLPLLILSPLSITSAHTPPTGRSIYCTPLKTLQDDEARTESVFTPVTLPKDWMQTVSAQSPQTYNMSTPTLWNEQKRLDCEEYISSEDEELSKLSHNQAQSLHHRPGKLHWDHLQHLMDSDAGEKRKKGASNRRENMKCRRSLNMSLEFKENNNTTDSSGFGTTEACIEDFDRYYQQLKDSKSEDYREESGVSVDEMYGLVVDTATMHLRAYTDTTLSPLHTTLDDYKRPQHIVEDQMFDDSFTDFLCEPIDWHSTDEYSPLTACKISASVSPDNDVSQIVPKVTNQSMWTDNLDTQLVPSQLENINLNIKTEPTEDTDMDQLTPLECQVLSNEPESKKGESFSTADVLKFIRHQLVSEGVDVIGMMDREDEGLHCEPSESSHVDFGPFLAQMDNGEPEGFDDDLVTQKELLSVGDLSLYQVSGDEEDSGFVTQDCISPLPTLSWT